MPKTSLPASAGVTAKSVNLTIDSIEKAPAKSSKYAIRVKDMPNLYLTVYPSKERAFTFRWETRDGDSRKTSSLTLATWVKAASKADKLALIETVRAEHARTTLKVRNGDDPRAKAGVATEASSTEFFTFLNAWLDSRDPRLHPETAATELTARSVKGRRGKRRCLATSTVKGYRWAAEKHLRRLQHRDIRKIKKGDVTAILDHLFRPDGTPRTAMRVMKLLNGVFAHAVRIGLIAHNDNPMPQYLKPDDVSFVPKDRALADWEIWALWQGCLNLRDFERPGKWSRGHGVGVMARLALLTMCRSVELVGICERELVEDFRDTDSEGRPTSAAYSAWVIPADRMKNRLTHVLPRLPMFEDVRAELPAPPGGFSPDQPMFKGCLNNYGGRALHNILQPRIDAICDKHGLPRFTFTLHDLRRTASVQTRRLKDNGRLIHADLVEVCLSHRPMSQVGVTMRTYNPNAQHMEEKSIALELWHGRLAQIIAGDSIEWPESIRQAAE